MFSHTRHLVLLQVDSEEGMARVYSLMIERDLFCIVRPARSWGLIGTNGEELVEVFDSEICAGVIEAPVGRSHYFAGQRRCERLISVACFQAASGGLLS